MKVDQKDFFKISGHPSLSLDSSAVFQRSRCISTTSKTSMWSMRRTGVKREFMLSSRAVGELFVILCKTKQHEGQPQHTSRRGTNRLSLIMISVGWSWPCLLNHEAIHLKRTATTPTFILTYFFFLFSCRNFTAVCIYSIEMIETVFQNSSFTGYDQEIPRPRPGTVRISFILMLPSEEKNNLIVLLLYFPFRLDIFCSLLFITCSWKQGGGGNCVSEDMSFSLQLDSWSKQFWNVW